MKRRYKHQLEPYTHTDPDRGPYICTVCGQRWIRRPGITCPGVHFYDWGEATEHLKTASQLKADGLKLAPDQQPTGCVIGKDIYYLYDETQAVTRPPATEAQLAAAAKSWASRTCVKCGRRVRRKRDLTDGLCDACWHYRMLDRARDEAITWAREVLADERAIILDTETTGLSGGAEIVEIAIVDIHGQPLLDTLIRPVNDIPTEASAVHGINAADVADAPTWPEIHDQVGELLRQASRIVIYNADYDERLLDQTRELHDLPPFAIDADRFECAMWEFAGYVGEWSTYHDNFRWQRLPYGNHRALGDCLGTLRVLREMAADQDRESAS